MIKNRKNKLVTYLHNHVPNYVPKKSLYNGHRNFLLAPVDTECTDPHSAITFQTFLAE
jgi:hypothetical protein